MLVRCDQILYFCSVQNWEALKTEALASAGWCVDDMSVEEERLFLEGWSLDRGVPLFALETAGEIVNIQRFERPDLDALFAFFPSSEPKGFRIEICSKDKRWQLTRKGGDKLQGFSGPTDLISTRLPIPDAELRFRVHGGRDLAPFFIEGHSAAQKIAALGDQYLGPKGLVEVLDWGCGCGRVSRWLNRPDWRMHGVDIDHENAAWCHQHLGKGEAWLGCDLEPPTPFEDASFDLIFGISVFTHLGEEAQFRWLSELKRLLRPGGVALVTVHGLASAARFDLPDSAWAQWFERGFFDLGPSRDLEAVFGELEHYRGSLHTAEYVRAHWSSVLEVEAVHPAVIGNHQDVVILRR